MKFRILLTVLCIYLFFYSCLNHNTQTDKPDLSSIYQTRDTATFVEVVRANHNDIRLQLRKFLNEYIRVKAEKDTLAAGIQYRQLDWLIARYRESKKISDLSRRLSASHNWDSSQARLKLDRDSTLAALRKNKYQVPLASLADSLLILNRDFQALNDSLALADILYTRGDILLINGETDSAIHYLNNCIQQCELLDYYSLKGVCSIHLGYIYNTLENDFLKSERAYIDALNCFRKVDLRWRVPYALTGRIYNFLQLYQTPKAISLINQALNEFEQLGDSSGIALCKYYLAEAYYNNSEYDSALYYAGQSARIRRSLSQGKNSQVSDWAYSVSCQALNNQALNKLNKAIEDYHRADSLFNISGNTQGHQMNLIRWGDLHLNQKDYRKARDKFTAVYNNSENYENYIFSLYGLAVCDFNQNKFLPAVEKLKACINMVELAGRKLPIPDIKTGMLSDKIGFYNLLAGVYIKQFDADSNYAFLDSAFNVIEKSKCRALVDNLTNQNAPDFSSEEDDILNNISQIQKKLINGEGKTDSLWSVISLLEDSLHILRINTASYQDYKLPARTSLITVQKEITDNRTAVLEYLLSEFGLEIFVVTKDNIEVVSSDIEYGRLKKLIIEYLDLINHAPHETDPTDDILNAGKELYSILFPQKLSTLTSLKNIIVVPSGLIHHLPLETIVCPDNRYLVEKYNISYMPSATTGLILAHQSVTRAKSNLVIFGYSPNTTTTLRTDTLSPDKIPSSSNPYDNLSPLPYCEAEIDDIISLFKPDQVRHYRGTAATETNFKGAEFDMASFVHIAAHGLTDEQHPNRSAVILSFEDEFNDGLLQAAEISRMKIPARLVFLSACQTGTGRTYPGEGILNLARPFIRAGCRSAIVTCWNINDRFALELVKDFYGKILEGGNISQALADAKRRALSSPRRQYHHPYYWAPYILVGQGL